jgi:uncharacterized protein YndB with AHSA1/START domain
VTPVESDRTYRFDADAATVWAAFADTTSYPRCWPWLRAFEASRLAPGEVWRCVVRPPLPYEVRFTLTLHEVVEGRSVAAALGGDLDGRARLDLRGDGEGRSVVRLRAAIEPTRRLLRTMAALAAPVARYGHDWILDTGARQYAAAL